MDRGQHAHGREGLESRGSPGYISEMEFIIPGSRTPQVFLHIVSGVPLQSFLHQLARLKQLLT